MPEDNNQEGRRGYVLVRNIGELLGALRVVMAMIPDRTSERMHIHKMHEEGRDKHGNDLPKQDWQKSIDQ